MKIEHLTLGGNSAIRDTAGILETTKRVFNVIEYKNQVIHLPKLPFQIRITATEEGAIFDIQKDNFPVVVNICCFSESHKQNMLAPVRALSEGMAKAGLKLKILNPVTPQWLYSAVINPFGLNPSEMMTAGEVELYIFEQLYLGYKKALKTE